YTAAFIAEIVRGGILAVSPGQSEAAFALGLRKGMVLRFVVLPQALRIIVPPTTSQYLNLTKNSSLAVAIGYPDLVSIGNTTMNQTGQAVEAIAIFMSVYLVLSLSISLFMNWYNRAIALVEGCDRDDQMLDRSIERAAREGDVAPIAHPPATRSGIIGWLRGNLFNTWYNSVITLVLLYLLLQIIPGTFDWLFVNAVWEPATSEVCRAASGACWAFIHEKYRLILFGLYPYNEQWRPTLAVALFLGMILVSCNRHFWKPWLALAWAVVLALCGTLMYGGILGLTQVPTTRWGGLPLTLMLA